MQQQIMHQPEPPTQIEDISVGGKQKGQKFKTNLLQRLQNPRQRTYLDVLEFNYLRNMYSQAGNPGAQEPLKDS